MKIAEDDRLPKCLCYRCMYNLENFYDFRTACVNAVALLERCLPSSDASNNGAQTHMDQYTELRSELLKEKENMPILIPEAPIVNPNAALGTPPRLNSDGEADHEIEEILDQSGTDEGQDEHEDPKSDEYEMDMETNPSDFLEMTSIVTDDVEEIRSLSMPREKQDTSVFQHTSEQHEVYVCSLCNKAFSSKGHLSLHARIHVGAGDVIGEKVITDDHTSYKRPYQCDLCNKSYSTAKHRWGHVSTTHRGHPAVTCRYCSRIYSTRTNLEEHIKSRHAGLPPPPELPLPYIQPDNRFQCKTCPKMYTNVTDLNKHSRVCLGERRRELPNKISVQKSKSLIDTSDLSSMDSDDESKDYRDAEAKLAKNPQLTILKQALTKGDSLKRDYEDKNRIGSKPMKVARTDSSETDAQKRWYCETCPQNFTSVENLKEHEVTHEADKPYICILCEKDFVLKSSLSRHILTSHGVDPSPIVDSDKCLKKTVSNLQMRNKQAQIIYNESKLTKEASQSPFSPEMNMDNDEEDRESGHENMIEIETVFVCEICTRDFNDRASLWLHIRATHKEFAAFACGVCLKICSDNTQLLNHVNMYHGGSKLQVSEQRRYSCTICGRQHDSRKKLITHVSIHNVDPGYDPASFVQLNSNYYNENLNSNEANEQPIDFDGEDGEKIDCYICYKSFPNEDHLIRHQRNAHKSEPLVQMGDPSNGNGSGSTPGNGNRAQYHLFFVCELCGSSHPSKWERWLHVSGVHSNEPAIRCEREDCGKIFATRSLRNEHVQHHLLQGASPNTCEICGKLWGSRVDYWKHVMGVHSDTVPLICGVCLKVFPDVIQLSAHVKSNHWPLTNGDFSCDICGRPYSNKSKMSRHRKIHGLDTDSYANSTLHEVMNDSRLDQGSHESDLTCEMCSDVKFTNLDDLCNHRRTAHGLFPCDLCNKCYGRTSHLWKHVNRVHKGHEDVTCRYCLKTSASRDHLAAHIAKIHRYEPEMKKEIRESSIFKSPNPEDETLHHCEKCNKGFHKRYLLRRHMKGCQNYRKDPGALLTRCRACERIFKDRASLQKHIENHHSTYTCHLCDETITSKLGIMTHNRVNHMNHPDLTCDYTSCKKLFRTKEDLESHRKDHKYLGTPNVCDFCGDTVENKLKLKMHILSLHRNEIGVSCGVCLIPMKDPKELKRHVEDVHRSILSKPNTCQVCGKQYASKWKAFDHTKKCHGKVFRTCKQCLAVFTSDEDIKHHYEHVHNVPKDQLAGFEFRLDVGPRQEEFDAPDIVVKEEPQELDFYEEPCEEDYHNSKRRRSFSDTLDCEMCPEIFLNDVTLAEHYRNVHNTDPMRIFKKLKLDTAKRKTKNRENFECKNCRKQFSTKTLFWNHINVCSKRNSINRDDRVYSTSILESHLKNNNQIKKEEPEPILNESNLNIPDFNLFEDINMQLSGQKPVPNLMPLSHMKSLSSIKCSRKDSRKVYDESTNTECACEVCGKQWPAKKHLWQHLIRFHRTEAAVTCGVCLKLCKTYQDLADHLKAAHEAILTCEGNNFTCKTCGRYHNARSKLLLHMSIHINCNGSSWCRKCQQSFESEDKLKEHVAICTGGNQVEYENHSNDLENAAKNNENDHDYKNILMDDEHSLMEEVDEVEEVEFETEASDNREDSNSDDSGDSDSDSNPSSSDDEDNDNENEDEAECRTNSRATEVSSDSESANQDSDEDKVNVAKDHHLEQSEDIKCNNIVKAEPENEEESQYLQYKEESPALKVDEYPMEERMDHENHEVVKVEADAPDYSDDDLDEDDDDGPPVLSPMMPLPPVQDAEHDNRHLDDEIQHELTPMVSIKKSNETEGVDDDDHQEFKDQIENGKSTSSSSEYYEKSDPQKVSSNVPSVVMGESQSDTEEEGEAEGDEEEYDSQMEAVDQTDEENKRFISYETHNTEDSVEGSFAENFEDETMEVEVADGDGSVQIHDLDGTVLMVANDSDGNQILIQRNVADVIENDDSNPEVTEYVYQEGQEYELEEGYAESQQADDVHDVSDEVQEEEDEIGNEEFDEEVVTRENENEEGDDMEPEQEEYEEEEEEEQEQEEEEEEEEGQEQEQEQEQDHEQEAEDCEEEVVDEDEDSKKPINSAKTVVSRT
ncbi:zinc finger protein Xfin isoform X2 [Cephus cinctus]|uniref:Zinc finger protein Xfin isoform X2 n=1 Tax=Cephus cinctus TaxID=211228 RepID=A0AAJ7W2E0_CEPCN|nr:zinc finger protein Xfin isoform X2 [Cephus cinctus]